MIAYGIHTLFGHHHPKPNAAKAKPRRGQIVYRVWGDGAAEDGRYWSPDDPATCRGNYRAQNGLPDANSGEYVAVGRVKDPNGILSKKADPYESEKYGRRWPGGAPEYLVKPGYDVNDVIEIEYSYRADPAY